MPISSNLANNMKRRSSLKIPESELNNYIRIIEDNFSSDWLNKNDNNPVQLLWKRNDELATNELYSLAYAIKELNKIDPIWTKQQIKKAKSHDRNEYRGAIFEILVLNLLNSTEHPVIPAKINQAGYDGKITKAGGQEIRVSIKNYGCSTFQLRFEKKAKEIENVIKNLLKKYSYPASQILLDFPDIYPEERHWKMLMERIDGIFKNQRNAENPFTALVEPIDKKQKLSAENGRTIFILIIYPIKGEQEHFHQNFQSYTLIISASYHNNEYLNLFSKINDACTNLSQHSANESDIVLNSLFLHIPETISVEQCIQWLDEYFGQFPEKQISIVFLYQTTVSTDMVKNTSGINNCLRVYIRSNKKIRGRYSFEIPVGTISEESSKLIFVAEHPDGTKETIPLENRYSYQHGEHYIKMMCNEKGEYTGIIKKLGGGVYTNVVFEMPGDTKSVIIKEKFAPSDELLIL